MPRLDADLGAVLAALDERPEVLHPGRVDLPVHVLLGVIDRRVREARAERTVRRERVRVVRAVLDKLSK